MTMLLTITVLGALLAGQAPPAAVPAAPAAAPAPVEAFTYDPEGRRDPFVSLLRSGTDSAARRAAGIDGVSGLSVNEISVRGVIAGKGGYIAMVVGPDHKTYLVRAQDKLLDGTVKSVTAQGLVILQEVNDPLSLVKQKEVRKMLRGLEEGK
jgi:type IV pilus assembly protein PilP